MNVFLLGSVEKIEVHAVFACLTHVFIPSFLNDFDKLVFTLVVLDGGGRKELLHFKPHLEKGLVLFRKSDVKLDDGFV